MFPENTRKLKVFGVSRGEKLAILTRNWLTEDARTIFLIFESRGLLKPFKRQPHKMVKHTHLFECDHFVRLALTGL